MSTATIMAILSAIQAVAGDKDLVEQIIALAKGPIESNREPTADEWAQMNALADQSHADVQSA